MRRKLLMSGQFVFLESFAEIQDRGEKMREQADLFIVDFSICNHHHLGNPARL